MRCVWSAKFVCKSAVGFCATVFLTICQGSACYTWSVGSSQQWVFTNQIHPGADRQAITHFAVAVFYVHTLSLCRLCAADASSSLSAGMPDFVHVLLQE